MGVGLVSAATRAGRGSRARTAMAIAVTVIVAAAGAFALWPRGVEQGSAPSAPGPHGLHSTPSPTGDVQGAATLTTIEIGESVEPPAEESIGSIPQVSLVDAAEAAAAGRDGAAGLGTPREAVQVDEVMTPERSLGGCHAAYGEDGQCLPSVPPSAAAHVAAMVDAGLDPADMPHPWSCDEVRLFFADGITVRVPGVDPDAIDPDGDGLACSPED
jgi:hypothetical protein